MPRASRVVAVFAFILLSASIAVTAQPQHQPKQHAITEDRGMDSLQLDSFFFRLSQPKRMHTAIGADQVCSKAIDIEGIFCAIACDCQCSTFGIFSQCCCSIS